jgi:hypothetical protein
MTGGPGGVLKAGYRCTCHHRGRHCRHACPATAVLVRNSDGRPVCEYCVDHDPEDSAGFTVSGYYWETS